jgi:Family of unknown function (DUF6401)
MRDDAYLKVQSGLDADELMPYIAGQIGQAALVRMAGIAHPVLDQHVAAVSDAVATGLGRRGKDPAEVLAFLARYASGFVDAAIKGGWRPAPVGDMIDWEAMRLAAVCQLMARLTQQASSAPSHEVD